VRDGNAVVAPAAHACLEEGGRAAGSRKRRTAPGLRVPSGLAGGPGRRDARGGRACQLLGGAGGWSTNMTARPSPRGPRPTSDEADNACRRRLAQRVRRARAQRTRAQTRAAHRSWSERGWPRPHPVRGITCSRGPRHSSTRLTSGSRRWRQVRPAACSVVQHGRLALCERALQRVAPDKVAAGAVGARPSTRPGLERASWLPYLGLHRWSPCRRYCLGSTVSRGVCVRGVCTFVHEYTARSWQQREGRGAASDGCKALKR
jgi:hypothetical protein